MILLGDCRARMAEMEENSVDAIVTDPPYFLLDSSGKGFMGKAWESINRSRAIDIVCRSKEFAQYVERLFTLLKVELDTGEGSFAQETANIKGSSKNEPSNSNAPSVVDPSSATHPKSKADTSFAPGIAITGAALLDLLTELSRFPITASGKIQSNALYVVPFSPLETQDRNIALRSALKLPTSLQCEERIIHLTLTEERRISDVIEAMNGRTSGWVSIAGTASPASYAGSIAGEKRYRLITSDLIKNREIMDWLIWLLYVIDATPRLSKDGKISSDSLNFDLIYQLHNQWADEAFRILKPGGYLLAFSGSRTYHRMACAIEDAGFILHPMIGWCFGSGFPKATSLSKAFDRENGINAGSDYIPNMDNEIFSSGKCKAAGVDRTPGAVLSHAPVSPEAIQWDGWYYGRQSLKPALEPVCMAQKPPEGRMVDNVLRWGCGAVNVDASRIGTEKVYAHGYPGESLFCSKVSGTPDYHTNTGRWPANLVLGHAPGCVRRGEKLVRGNGKPREGGFCAESNIFNNDEKYRTITCRPEVDPDGMETVADWDCVEGCPVRLISEQSGHLKSGAVSKRHKQAAEPGGGKRTLGGSWHSKTKTGEWEKSEGTAARFFLQITPDPDPIFYCAKASRAERNRGLEGLPTREAKTTQGLNSPEMRAARGRQAKETHRQNHHPTVKPLKLMRYLVRLVTPPGGVVLDPFAGSGTTLVAAKEEGFQYIGIELEPEYVEIAEARLAAAERPPATLEDFE